MCSRAGVQVPREAGLVETGGGGEEGDGWYSRASAIADERAEAWDTDTEQPLTSPPSRLGTVPLRAERFCRASGPVVTLMQKLTPCREFGRYMLPKDTILPAVNSDQEDDADRNAYAGAGDASRRCGLVREFSTAPPVPFGRPPRPRAIRASQEARSASHSPVSCSSRSSRVFASCPRSGSGDRAGPTGTPRSDITNFAAGR